MSKGILLSEHPPESGYLPASSIQVSLTPLQLPVRQFQRSRSVTGTSSPLSSPAVWILIIGCQLQAQFFFLFIRSPECLLVPRKNQEIPGKFRAGAATSPARCPAAPDSASELYQGSPPWYGCNPAYRCSFSGALPAGFPYHHPGPSAPTQNPGLPAPGRSSRRESAESSTRQTSLLPDAFYHSIP